MDKDINKRQIAALYCRLSKEDIDKMHDGDESASITNQRLLLTEYALEHGFEIYDTYQDDDYSGLFNDRPDFERLIKDAKLQKFNVVIAKSQSRFTRNMEHMEKYLHTMFPLLGIRFLGVVDNADTLNKGNKKSRQINGLVNEWYCEDLSDNIKAVFQSKMKMGQFLGSSTPYGYIRDPNNHNHLIIDEYASEIVKRIFNLYISGVGKNGIAKILDDEGILIPSIYKKQILGQNYHNAKAKKNTRFWTFQTIHQILNNEVYTGVMVQYRHKTISYKSKKKIPVPQEEWIKVAGTHEAIITHEVWELSRELGKVRTRSIDTTQKIGLFSNKLYCADCGGSLVRKYNRKREFVGYHCSTYKKHGNSRCTSHSIIDDELKEIILSSIKSEARQILKQHDLIELNAIKLNSKKVLNVQSGIDKLKKQLKDIERYLKKCYEDYVDGVLDQKEYLQFKNKFNEERDELSNSLRALEKQLLESQNEKCVNQQYNSWLERFKNYMDIEELDRTIIVELIERIEVLSDGTIHLQYKFSNPYAEEVIV